jgi:hypothetical protein
MALSRKEAAPRHYVIPCDGVAVWSQLLHSVSEQVVEVRQMLPNAHPQPMYCNSAGPFTCEGPAFLGALVGGGLVLTRSGVKS